jgi:hypothetical protein
VKRCQFRGEKKVMVMGRWSIQPFRCDKDGTHVYDQTGEHLCRKHLRVELRREIAWYRKDLFRLQREGGVR